MMMFKGCLFFLLFVILVTFDFEQTKYVNAVTLKVRTRMQEDTKNNSSWSFGLSRCWDNFFYEYIYKPLYHYYKDAGFQYKSNLWCPKSYARFHQEIIKNLPLDATSEKITAIHKNIQGCPDRSIQLAMGEYLQRVQEAAPAAPLEEVERLEDAEANPEAARLEADAEQPAEQQVAQGPIEEAIEIEKVRKVTHSDFCEYVVGCEDISFELKIKVETFYGDADEYREVHNFTSKNNEIYQGAYKGSILLLMPTELFNFIWDHSHEGAYGHNAKRRNGSIDISGGYINFVDEKGREMTVLQKIAKDVADEIEELNFARPISGQVWKEDHFEHGEYQTPYGIPVSVGDYSVAPYVHNPLERSFIESPSEESHARLYDRYFTGSDPQLNYAHEGVTKYRVQTEHAKFGVHYLQSALDKNLRRGFIASRVLQTSCRVTPHLRFIHDGENEQLCANILIEALRHFTLAARDIQDQHHGIVIMNKTPQELANFLGKVKQNNLVADRNRWLLEVELSADAIALDDKIQTLAEQNGIIMDSIKDWMRSYVVNSHEFFAKNFFKDDKKAKKCAVM